MGYVVNLGWCLVLDRLKAIYNQTHFCGGGGGGAPPPPSGIRILEIQPNIIRIFEMPPHGLRIIKCHLMGFQDFEMQHNGLRIFLNATSFRIIKNATEWTSNNLQCHLMEV